MPPHTQLPDHTLLREQLHLRGRHNRGLGRRRDHRTITLDHLRQCVRMSLPISMGALGLEHRLLDMEEAQRGLCRPPLSLLVGDPPLEIRVRTSAKRLPSLLTTATTPMKMMSSGRTAILDVQNFVATVPLHHNLRSQKNTPTMMMKSMNIMVRRRRELKHVVVLDRRR